MVMETRPLVGVEDIIGVEAPLYCEVTMYNSVGKEGESIVLLQALRQLLAEDLRAELPLKRIWTVAVPADDWQS